MILFIENKRSEIGKIITDIFSKYVPNRYPSPTQLGDYYLGKGIRPNFTDLNVDDYNDLFEDFKSLKTYRTYLITYSFYPIILLSTILIISLVSFLFTDYLYTNSNVGMTFFTGLIVLSALSVVEVVLYIKNVVFLAIDLDKEKTNN